MSINSQKLNEHNVNSKSISYIRSLSFYLKDYKKIQHIANKFYKLSGLINSGAEVKTSDKLSLKEFGIILKFSNFADKAPRMDFFENIDSENGSNILQIVINESKKMKEMIAVFQSKFQEEVSLNNLFQSGDIMAFDSTKFLHVKGYSKDAEDVLRDIFISSKSHGAKIYRKENPSKAPNNSLVMISHLLRTYKNEELGLQDVAVSDIWRLNIAKLLKPSNNSEWLRKICENRGISVEEHIQKTFQNIETNIHKNLKETRPNFTNLEQRRFAAGKADYGLAGWHQRKKEKPESFKKIHQAFFQGFKYKNSVDMMCSEFVTKGTVASLIELDFLLTEEVAEFMSQENKMPQKANKEALFKDSTHSVFIRLPYSPKERLKRVHPGRMISLLKKNHCIEKVSKPQIINDLFRA